MDFGLDIDRTHNLIRLRGSLTLHSLPEAGFEEAVQALDGDVTVDASGLTGLDTAGALLLNHIRDIEAEHGRQVRYAHFHPDHDALFTLVDGADFSEPPRTHPGPVLPQLLIRLGKGAVSAFQTTLEIIAFLGQSSLFLVRGLRHPKHLRLASISRHIDETGLDAVPIVCLIAFLISIVLAYQGAQQLRPLGAEQFTVDLVGLSVLREMSVLLTAIMVAGRSGSAFTAEIGVMKVREEVDALRVIGIDPFEVLVMPRLLALLITLPLLTFIADMMGLFGGAVISMALLEIPLPQYMERLSNAADGYDFFVGMIKAPVFAFLIAVVGCMHGMKVTGSAESVGTRTTLSVVHSIFLVLIADALFSILFEKLGI